MVETVAHLHAILHAFLQKHDAPRYVLAVSGGMDSMVLMHAMQTVCRKPMFVVHVNHQISARAADWAEMVERAAEQSQLPSRVLTVQVQAGREGLEAAARAARYQAIESLLQPGDVVLTGHHQNDQAETLLLNLCRGAGVQGLSAMAQARPLGHGVLARPFLQLSRSDIQAYVNSFGLPYVEDDSNSDERFARNFLRAQVMPSLSQQWPDATAKLAQAAEKLREAQEVMDDFAAMLLDGLSPRSERFGWSLNMDALLALPPRQRNLVLRHWLMKLEAGLPSAGHLAALVDAMQAEQDQQPEWRFGAVVFRRFQGRLYCLAAEPLAQLAQWVEVGEPLAVDVRSPIKAACYELVLEDSHQGGLQENHDYRLLPRGRLAELGVVERSKPRGRGHSQTLKRLLQEREVPPWLRPSLPVLVLGDRIAAVADLWVDEAFWAAGAAKKVSLRLAGEQLLT